MAKIAVLLPREFMLEQAKKVIEEEQMDISILKVIKTADSVYEAREAVENGAGIIVARGVQASFIKAYTNVPLVEIALTGQEIGLLITKAKKMLKKECPQIAIIGYENMYHNMSYFDEIFQIKLKTYFIDKIEQAKEMVERAIVEGADCLIGGDTVVALGEEREIPVFFIDSTEDSIRNALQIAKKMSYTAEAEKSHAAQLEAVLDSSANGVIKINEKKEITIINKMVEELLKKKSNHIEGKSLDKAVPELDMEYVDAVLLGKRDTYTTSVHVNGVPVMITTSPIQYEDRIIGAILSCFRLTSRENVNTDQSRTMYLRGYAAKANFSDLNVASQKMKQAAELAKMYALSSRPVLIYGEKGTEKEVIAQCIHNNSAYKSGPFVAVNVGGMTEQMQIDKLFGNPLSEDESIKKGAMALGDLGTVLIEEVENLTLVCQYRLYRAIQYASLIQNDLERSQTLDNRVMVTATKNLSLLVREGAFREDLYYLLNSLVVELPPLRERAEDIEVLIQKYRSDFSKKYSRFLKITEGARKCLINYPWEGNKVQLEAFCERMFLTTQKKTISEDFVQALLDELYPEVKDNKSEEMIVIYKHPEAARIASLLEKCHGSRSAVAKELGISTTTLWRRMKKYGIMDKQ